MYLDLLIVLSPLFIGYCFSFRSPFFVKLVHYSVSVLVYIILLLIGISLAATGNIFKEFTRIFTYAAVFCVVIHLCNIMTLMVYDRKMQVKRETEAVKEDSKLKMLIQSAQLVSMVLIGLLIGLLTKDYFTLPAKTNTYALMLLFLFIGIQLRGSGIPLNQVLLNRHGTAIAILFILSSLFGGVISALLLGMPIHQGLAISSGFGWYTLSSIVINEALGPVLASIALFNDLAREIIALMMIPIFMRHHPATAVGIGGATSLDFTLPVIQRSGGLEMVPIAISFGFIVNLLAPVLLAFFANY